MSGNLAVGPMSVQPLRTANSEANSRLTAEQKAGFAQEIIDTQNKAVDRLIDKVAEFYNTELTYAFHEITKNPIEAIRGQGVYIMAVWKKVNGEFVRENKGQFLVSHVKKSIEAANVEQTRKSLSKGEEACFVLTIDRLAKKILYTPEAIMNGQSLIDLIDRIEFDGIIKKCTENEAKVAVLRQSKILQASMLDVINDYRKEIALGKYKPALLANDRIWRFAKSS